jgi:cysteinyl-tRNA synthetase
MSMKYLGETFDLHCGAVDLIFPHHENEIAQSEAATAKPFVRYWVHGEHLIVDGEKMSKSKGNFFTLRDLLKKGIQPGVIRYALQSVPYKRQLNFTSDAVRQAGASLQRLQDFRQRIETETLPSGASAELQSGCQAVLEKFEAAMDQDLNTAQALAAIFDWVREVNTALAAGRVHDGDGSLILATMDRLNRVLPLWEAGESGPDPQIQSLIEQRSRARQARDFALADEFRDRIFELGYLIEDTRDGVRWKNR